MKELRVVTEPGYQVIEMVSEARTGGLDKRQVGDRAHGLGHLHRLHRIGVDVQPSQTHAWRRVRSDPADREYPTGGMPSVRGK